MGTNSSHLLDSAITALTNSDLRLAARRGSDATFEVVLEKLRLLPVVIDGRAELSDSDYLETPGIADGERLFPKELFDLIWQLLRGKGDFVEADTRGIQERFVYKILGESIRSNAENLANNLAQADSTQARSLSESDLARLEDHSRHTVTEQIFGELSKASDSSGYSMSPFFIAGILAVILKLIEMSGDESLLPLFEAGESLTTERFFAPNLFARTEREENMMAQKLSEVAAFVQKVQALSPPW